LRDFLIDLRGGCGAVIAAAEHDPHSSAAIKENLLKWCQIKTAGYPVNIRL